MSGQRRDGRRERWSAPNILFNSQPKFTIIWTSFVRGSNGTFEFHSKPSSSSCSELRTVKILAEQHNLITLFKFMFNNANRRKGIEHALDRVGDKKSANRDF